MSEEANDVLGRAIDTVDNLAHALTLPISDSLHVEALRAALPEAVAELKKGFALVTGENPWA
jgi:hypothetical protein